jgi:hypothetical protein
MPRGQIPLFVQVFARGFPTASYATSQVRVRNECKCFLLAESSEILDSRGALSKISEFLSVILTTLVRLLYRLWLGLAPIGIPILASDFQGKNGIFPNQNSRNLGIPDILRRIPERHKKFRKRIREMVSARYPQYGLSSSVCDVTALGVAAPGSHEDVTVKLTWW